MCPTYFKKAYGHYYGSGRNGTNQSCIFIKLICLQNDAALLLAGVDLIQSEVQSCQLQHHLETTIMLDRYD